MSITRLTTNGVNGSKYDTVSADNYYMEPIATTLLTGTATTITFSNIPQNYKNLQLRIMILTNTSAVDAPYLRCNGDSGSNYTLHTLLGEGVSARSQGITSLTWINIGGFWNGTIGSNPSVSITDILDYTNPNKLKTIRTLAGQDNNSTLGSVGLGSGLWLNTAAITSLTIHLSGSTVFSANSRFSLYGIKG